MSLVSNLTVGSAAPVLAIQGKARCRQVNVTVQAGSGSVYYQLQDHLPLPQQSTSNLTTGNGTLIPAQPNPYSIILTPGYTQSPQNPSNPGTTDDSDGFDLYLISNTSATVNVQTVPT